MDVRRRRLPSRSKSRDLAFLCCGSTAASYRASSSATEWWPKLRDKRLICFDAQDELAESQIPNPGYAPGQDITYETYTFDLYDYWEDLMYGEDEYWDTEGGGVSISGEKRKRGLASRVLSKGMGKRRKLSLKDTDGGNVRFIPLAARVRTGSRAPLLQRKGSSFALLPDWRQQFADATGIFEAMAMPMDMKEAAEAGDQVTPLKTEHQHVKLNDEDEIDEDDDEDAQVDLLTLEPETLKAILKQKLGDAGLAGMDENAFMHTISKMLSEDEGADDVAGELADSLLGRVAEGNDHAVSGWLSKQGVKLDAEEDYEDDEASISVAQRPSDAGNTVKSSTQASPRDSAIGSSKGEAPELILHGSSPLMRKKRSAPLEADRIVKKRKSEVGSQNVVIEEAPEDDDSIAVSADPEAEKDTIAVANTKEANTQASTTNKTRSAKSKTHNRPSMNGSMEEHDGVAEEIKVTPPKSRATRKRKMDADAEDDAHGSSESRQTKQAKKTAEASNEDLTGGRRTRSARARAGK